VVKNTNKIQARLQLPGKDTREVKSEEKLNGFWVCDKKPVGL